jgi:hypothetical protein
MSLYRKRGRGDGRMNEQQLKRVRTAMQDYAWGSLKGVTIRVKVVGQAYDECKVLA